MKKICFVAEYMFCGGVEKSLIALLQSLDKRKYDITVLLMDKKGALLSQIPEEVKVDVIQFPEDEKDELLYGRKNAIKNAIRRGDVIAVGKKIFRGMRIFCKYPRGAARRLAYYQSIESKIKDYPESFDIVVDYMGYGLFNTFYAARKVCGNVKLSWIHFEPDTGFADFYVFRKILDEYNWLICVSESAKKQMMHMIPELTNKYAVFYNIVDAEFIRQQLREEGLNKPSAEIAICSVGRLDPQKGFDLGVKVIAKLRYDGYNVKWYVIGGGWQEKYLQKLISETPNATDGVVLMGQKLNPYPYMNMCDIYLQPSRHEGYCIALAEARALCKPIVATDFAGAREQLEHNKTGIICQCSEEAIYVAVKKLITDEKLRNTLAKNLCLQNSTQLSRTKILEDLFHNV